MEIDKLNSEILREIEEVIDNVGGYYIIVKLDDGLKAGIDVFKINSIKYKISQNLKIVLTLRGF